MSQFFVSSLIGCNRCAKRLSVDSMTGDQAKLGKHINIVIFHVIVAANICEKEEIPREVTHLVKSRILMFWPLLES